MFSSKVIGRSALPSAVLISVALSCAPPATDPGSTQEPQFRAVRWGMTPEEVRVTERARPKSDTGNRLQYNARVFDQAAGLTYAFTDGKLTHAWYTLLTRYSEEIPTFDRLKAALAEEYGEPVRDEHTWAASVPDQKAWQEALTLNRRGYKDVTWLPWSERIKSGDLSLIAEWDTIDAGISLKLYGGHDVLHFRLVYESRTENSGTIGEE